MLSSVIARNQFDVTSRLRSGTSLPWEQSGREGGQSPLLRFVGGGGTFTRASEGGYFTQPPTSDGATPFLAWASANVIREDKRDGVSGGYLFERGSTNLCLWSEDFTNAVWTKTNVTVPTTNGVAPDGEADCDTLSFGALATDNVSQNIAGTANNTVYQWAVWIRKPSGAGNIRLQTTDRAGVVTTSVNLAVGTTWTRHFQSLNWGTGALTPAVAILNDSGGGAQDLQVWGAAQQTGVQSIVGIQPSMYIRTTSAAASSSTDRLTFPSTPLAMRQGRYQFRHAPQGDSTTHSGDQCPFEFEGISFNDSVNIRPIVNASINVRKDNVILMTRGPAITYSANQILTITLDLANGACTLAGATTGNGTGYTNPVTFVDGAMEVGGVTGGAWANARIWEPYELPAVTWTKQLDFVAGGTYTRALEASYFTAPANTTGSFLAWAAANTIREDKRDGVSGLYLFEPSRINNCLWSEDFTNAAWVKTGATISGTTATAPDGDADCNTISFTGAGQDVTQAIAGTIDATTFASSIWVRKTSGSGNVRLRTIDRAGLSTTTADLPISTTWTRLEQVLSWGTGASAPSFGIVNDAAGTTQDVEVWGAQVERTTGNNSIPTSNIRTTTAAVTRNID